VTDLHTLANAISNSSPNIRAFALAVADKLEPAAPPPTPSGVWWAGPQPPDTSWIVPVGVMAVSTQADLRALCASGGKGGAYRVAGFTYNGNLDIGNRNGLTLYFDPAWKLVGPVGSSNPAVGVHGAGLQLYGGDISNPQGGSGTSGGDGVKAYNGSSDPGPTDLLWHGLKIHDVAAQGLSTQASTSIHADVQADITRWGLNPSLDPHTVKGTGLHGAYIGGGAGPTSGRFILTVHDGAVGAGCQAGAYLQNTELWLAINNLGWVTDRLAGNGFQPWGGHDQGIVVKSLLVDGAQSATFFESLSSGPVAIEYGRYRNIRLSPAYQASSHVTYKDWTKAA
jgi:hypothetical protein